MGTNGHQYIVTSTKFTQRKEREEMVTLLQLNLTYLGYDIPAITGRLDEETILAIQEFQRQHGMMVTGLYTDDLLDQLEDSCLNAQKIANFITCRLAEPTLPRIEENELTDQLINQSKLRVPIPSRKDDVIMHNAQITAAFPEYETLYSDKEEEELAELTSLIQEYLPPRPEHYSTER
jgi:peptidoglycan hydrolase-like protein with peptidoglycan-binding domain